jgi:transposase-like protein
MSTRDIRAHVGELYGVSIFADLVSAVTEAVQGFRNCKDAQGGNGART